jgi:hypothetical protein
MCPIFLKKGKKMKRSQLFLQAILVTTLASQMSQTFASGEFTKKTLDGSQEPLPKHGF